MNKLLFAILALGLTSKVSAQIWDFDGVKKLPGSVNSELEESIQTQRDQDSITAKRIFGIKKLSTHIGKVLLQRRRTYFSDQSSETHAAIAISKKYETANPGYWYGFHKRQRDFLKEANVGYMLYGMLDRESFYAIPYGKLEEWMPKMHSTHLEGRDPYWHVRIFDKVTGLVLKLNDGTEIPIDEYAI
jgi:hypothetical protein